MTESRAAFEYEWAVMHHGHDRPYRKGMTESEARKWLIEEKRCIPSLAPKLYLARRAVGHWEPIES